MLSRLPRVATKTGLSRIPARRISNEARALLQSANTASAEAITKKAEANIATVRAYQTKQSALGKVASSVAEGSTILQQHGLPVPSISAPAAAPAAAKAANFDPSIPYLALGLLATIGTLVYPWNSKEEEDEETRKAQEAEAEFKELIDQYKAGTSHEDLYVLMYDLIDNNYKKYTFDTPIIDPELVKFAKVFRAVISNIKLPDIVDRNRNKVYVELANRPIENIGNILGLLNDYLAIIGKKKEKSPEGRDLVTLTEKIKPGSTKSTGYLLWKKEADPFREYKGGRRKRTKNRRSRKTNRHRKTHRK